MPDSRFDKSVFINCPFDDLYRPLLRALLFTVIDCDLEPRIASESAHSGEPRIEKIKRLIRESFYSIHDISRIVPLTGTELPRFNMPFELGLDLGCCHFGAPPLSEKRCLILEEKKYRYQEVLSDIAGQDIKSHDSDPQKIVKQVRNWLVETLRIKLPSGTQIWQRFNVFQAALEIEMEKGGYDRDEIVSMPDAEFMDYVKEWKSSN